MNILITNDDGWGTPGIVLLTRLMSSLQADAHVYVVAPNGPRSAFSSKVSLGQKLYMERVVDDTLPANVQVWTTDGTPADCVKLAINIVLKDQPIDLIVSGINHGNNCSVNLVYSGTMGAALIGAENGIPAIGFSIDDHSMDADLHYLEAYIQDLTRHLLDNGMETGICYNVNAPIGAIQGIRWTRQASGYWQKEFVEDTDEAGQPCYRMTGDYVNREPDAADTDMWALAHGYLSVQPVTIDMTAYSAL